MYAGRLVSLFLVVKAITVLLGILSAYAFYPYVANTDLLLHLHQQSGASAGVLDSVVRRALSPFARWDAIYFLRIADGGYQFEQQHAFFPLFPLLIRAGAEALKWSGLSRMAACMLTGIVISNLAHFLTMVNVFTLSMTLGSDEYFAFVAAAFVVLSPAYIFQTAICSESLFALLATTGMLAFYRRRWIVAALCFSLAGATRSNGVLLAGFFLHDGWMHLFSGASFLHAMLKSFVAVAVSLAGYMGFQYYGYAVYCRELPGRPWCHAWLPNMYGFVQRHYWNVGLFKYYTAGQLPNFFIASPIILASFAACWGHFRADPRRTLTLGVSHSRDHGAAGPFLYQSALFPHFVLLAALLIYSLLVVHVQIMPRLFSFQPAVYWSLAHFYTTGSPRLRTLIAAYSAVAVLIGSLLYMNYYPPA